MRFKTFVQQILTLVAELIASEEYKNAARTEARYFSRERKMGFMQYIHFILGNNRRSLQVELDDFMKNTNAAYDAYSKQAFSKQRQYIKPEAIQELFYLVSTQFYQLAEYETYKGYVVTAIDGSRLNLPDSKELKNAYGTQKSSGVPQNQALVSGFYDVLNGIMLDAIFAPCHSSERTLAAEHFNVLEKYNFPKMMVLMDRGYPSATLIEELEQKQLSYVMRCPSTFLSEKELDGSDCIIDHKFKAAKQSHKLRVLRFAVGENSVTLATNILDNSFTIEDFKELYRLRWEIETVYDHLKNNADLENFSGTTKTAVLQDFYATLFLLNVAQETVFESRDAFNDVHNASENKLRYKQNLAQTIGHLKGAVVKMLLFDSNIQRQIYFAKICKEIVRCATPIRPGRSFPRKVKHKSRKHHNGKKRT